MRKLTLALAAAALLATAPTASAATLKVTGGKLEWTMPNQYTGSGDTTRTWLGYLTNTVGGGASNGSAAVTAPATLAGPAGSVTSVDTTAARGTDQLYTFTYPVAAAGGSYSENGVGSVELAGTATWTTHNLPITTVDPLITLNGLTGTLKASGMGASMSGAMTPYDRTSPQLTLDLSGATVTLRADGSRVIDGIVPLAVPGSVFIGAPASSRVFFGTMKLTLGVEYPEPATGPQGPAGPSVLGSPGTAGPVGPRGPAGPRGATGKSAKISTFTLKKAPFAGTAKRSVKLLQRKTGKVLGTGTIQGRKLRVSHLTSTKLKGSYVLRTATGTRRAVVTIK